MIKRIIGIAVAAAIALAAAGPAFATPNEAGFKRCFTSSHQTLENCCRENGGTWTDKYVQNQYGKWVLKKGCLLGNTFYYEASSSEPQYEHEWTADTTGTYEDSSTTASGQHQDVYWYAEDGSSGTVASEEPADDTTTYDRSYTAPEDDTSDYEPAPRSWRDTSYYD